MTIIMSRSKDEERDNLKNFDTRTYNISDFAEWKASGTLILDAKFQRRSVWSRQAKSYLIDTILRGRPMPKVLITQALVDGRNVRTVVDGQQRLRAILEFLEGSFTVLPTHNKEFAGLFYDELPEITKSEFWQYELGVDVLFETELSDLLDIFARLNTYSVKLNETELLNATYLGTFKTVAHQLGHKYADYWLQARILTQANVARMGEVELSADILGAMIEGIGSKKLIKSYYKKYDDEIHWSEVNSAAERFNQAMQIVGEIYDPQELAQTNFKRVHLFYSLLLSVDEVAKDLSITISPKRMRVTLDNISAGYNDFIESGHGDSKMAAFVDASRRATTDADKRALRTRFIVDAIRQGV